MELTDAMDRFRGPLVGLIVSWGAAHVDASEIAQESFAEAYLSRDKCRGDWRDSEVFGRWLRGIARNKFRNWRRAHVRRARRIVLMEQVDLEQAAGHAQPDGVSPRISELRSAIDKLPARQRQVIMMHYLDESSVKDVAALLSVSVKTVEGRLYQARRALKRMLDQPESTAITKALLL